MPSVSVITLMFNAEPYIRECLESVLAQTLQDMEVIVVDDGSTDGSAQIVETIACGDRRVTLLKHPRCENRGVSHSRQIAVKATRSEFIAFVDADDIAEPNKVASQIETLNRHPHAVLCHTGIRVIGDAESHQARGRAKWINANASMGEYAFSENPHFLTANPICNSATMVRAKSLRDVWFAFPQAFQYEDWTLWVLLSQRGPFVAIPEQLTCSRYHASSFTYLTGSDHIKSLYCRLEMLLSVIALADSPELIGNANGHVQALLGELVERYGDDLPLDPRKDLPDVPGADDVPYERLGDRVEFWKRRLQAAQDHVHELTRDLTLIRNSRLWRVRDLIARMLNRGNSQKDTAESVRRDS